MSPISLLSAKYCIWCWGVSLTSDFSCKIPRVYRQLSFFLPSCQLLFYIHITHKRLLNWRILTPSTNAPSSDDPRRLDWLSNMIARLFSQYNYFKGWSLHSVKYKIGPSLSFAVITVVKDQFIVCTYAKLIARLSALNTVPTTTQTCYPISLN